MRSILPAGAVTVALGLFLFAFASDAGSASIPAPGTWPMFRGGPALLGLAGGTLQTNLSLLWNYKTVKGSVP